MRVKIMIEGETADLNELKKLTAAFAAAVNGDGRIEIQPETVGITAASEADKTALVTKLGGGGK